MPRREFCPAVPCHKMPGGEKGFTLFTALVAVVLIVLTMLLVEGMVRAEESTNDLIGDIEEQSEMLAISDLRRADAMQVFNYGVRERIESWLLNENYYNMTPKVSDWKAIQNDFAKSKFEGHFPEFAAQHLTNLLSQRGDSGPYEITLQSNVELLRNVLDKSTSASISNNDFFDVIRCEDGAVESCELGTFYAMLDVKSLSTEDYESLPQLVVENTMTKRKIKQPILPKAKFRIYVPIRLFKAIAIARDIAHRGNNGILDSAMHQTLADMKGPNASREVTESVLKDLAETEICRAIAGMLGGKKDYDGLGLAGGECNGAESVVVIAEAEVSGTEFVARVKKFEVMLAFKETNTKYMVSRKNHEAKAAAYRVLLIDTDFR